MEYDLYTSMGVTSAVVSDEIGSAVGAPILNDDKLISERRTIEHIPNLIDAALNENCFVIARKNDAQIDVCVVTRDGRNGRFLR